MPSFTLASQTPHLIIQPSDAALSPPESYLFVQDGLIISCGILYAFCYIFCMIRTYSDRTYPSASAKGIQFMSLTLAYELFYAVVTTTTTFELLAFLAWFLLDVGFVAVAIWRAHEKRDRAWLVRRIVGFVLAGMGVLKGLTMLWPDEREQVTAYWTGILLQMPIGWICLATLWKEWNTKGHSLEIWLMRYLGCYTAYGVFFWRYWNVPQNWEYVASVWSTVIILWTLLPETVYPFVYVWVHRTSKVKGE
ncbi:hypothetical protein AtubIFM56815_005584 [Aspergillus tubingensis]|uniref:Uncharacterized protein n=3 Tax=Aspergillus subgen. Circumdati TaxID=2720871 RepID=A0A1L9N7N7_ASPTC|nr:protein kinase domain family protein [Aspergillus tubingensis]OJI85114.1 hypothetical protein ASPTUDRAFT_119278 [Aspergillus tubingensis CBS 134.48]GAQ36242.1 hypothetical protein AKAW_05442 [Aspergillus niger]GFN14405.1 protein kinase domain family protein [Aspergillus tubingensis]GLA57221.1 hypothetical protein AtubIFM54640_003348 [Aspergillus tubingensis]GLA90035.1 hypothetical protein AtubIFM56815_005584 [Aspergillus tubingensis]